MAVRQARWILKQLCDADLEVNADKFEILHTSTECLEVLISKKPQSNKYNSQYPNANDLVQQIVSNKQQT